MLKFIFLIFLFVIIFAGASVLSLIWRLFSGPSRSIPKEKSRQGEDMVRDPNCGMFLPKQDALSATIKGRSHHFCSSECRDAYKNKN